MTDCSTSWAVSDRAVSDRAVSDRAVSDRALPAMSAATLAFRHSDRRVLAWRSMLVATKEGEL